MRNDDEYKQFAIDLYRNDGKAVQVCVVGTSEYEPPANVKQTPEQAKNRNMVRIDCWNGEDDNCHATHYVEPFGNGWWGEGTL